MLYTSVHHIIQVVLESSLDAKKKQILLIITKSKKLLGFINLWKYAKFVYCQNAAQHACQTPCSSKHICSSLDFIHPSFGQLQIDWC